MLGALICCLIAVPGVRAASAEPTATKAFVVVDDKSGHILLESKSEDKLQVASLTKIATATVVLDWARLGEKALDETVSFPAAALQPGNANPIGFQPGDEISVRDLLYAALLQSDNNAAEALAMYVGRSLAASASAALPTGKGVNGPEVYFVAQMNALARHLGMEKTRFLNPSGQDDKEKPFSTAADMARLTRNALTKSDFRFFIAQKERKITFTRAAVPNDYLLRNTNELLGVHNIDGVKTGQTTRAGSCLIITAARESLVQQDATGSTITPRRLIVVVLGSPDRFGEASRLLERGEAVYDTWAAAGRPLDPKQNL